MNVCGTLRYALSSVFAGLVLVGAGPPAALAVVIHVDADASPGGDGTSWPGAFRDLQDALALAASGDQIWVAEGIYHPTSGNDRNIAFTVPSGAEVYGGFAGDETEIEQRDPSVHFTILSGDLGGDDGPNFVRRGDNSRHVMTAPEPSGTRIDALIIERGNFDLDGELLEGGGGLFVLATGGSPKHVIVHQCTFRENSAGQSFQEIGNFGGGLLVRGADATITACTFQINRANAGGGLALFDRDASGVDVDMSVLVEDCDFLNNVVPTQTGGALWSAMGRAVTGTNEGHLDIRRCRFENNSAGYWGAWFDQNTTFVNASDCVFRGNSSDVLGGAVGGLQTGGVDTDPLRLDHCAFEGNQTDGSGGGLWMGAADAILRHCTFLGNEAGVGGGIFSSGYFQEEGAQDLILENCLLQGNTAQDAGAIRSGFNPILRIVSSTIANNEATNGISGGVFTRAGVADLDNTILHGNSGINGTSQTSQIRHFDGGTISINFCLVDGWSGSLGGVGNFGGDPLFPDPLGPDGQPGTGDEDLSIGAGSPCIDSGSNLVLPVGLDLDLAGNPRRSDDPDTPDTGAGTAPITDIGAYEFAGGATDVAEDSIRGAETFRLWPNPASGQIHVAFVLSKPARVRIEVVDAGGRVVSVPLADRLLTAGEHTLRCDLNSPRRPPLAAGVYWVRIRDGLAPRSETLVLRR